MEKRGGRVTDAGAERRRVRGALCRGEGLDAGLRLKERLGRQGTAGEEAGEGR